jgi:hypothetical protein
MSSLPYRIYAVLTLGIFIYAPRAGAVSATPGVFKGVIRFDASAAVPLANFVPDSVTIDAVDSTHVYAAHATATQGGVGCAVGSAYWCYAITVESALASSYLLRPIAYINQPSPYLSDRIPFPPYGPVGITSGATVTVPNIVYQPSEVWGSITAEDMSSAPLPILSAYLSMNDNSDTYPDPFTGSVEFFPRNSVFNAAPPPAPPFVYQLYLKPGDNYSYLSQSISINENAGAAHTVVVQNYGNQVFGNAPPGGTLVNKPYDFQQIAAISGQASAPPGFPVYNLEVNTTATSTTGPGLGVASDYVTNNASPVPLGSPINYSARIFTPSDLSQPIYVAPIFVLSADAGTLLQYPAQKIPGGAIAPGSTYHLDIGTTSATIAGNVVFNPPYPAKNFYPGIQGVTADGGLTEGTLVTNPSGGSFTLPAFVDNWQYWRWGWNFDLGNANFLSTYFVSQFLNIPVNVTTPGSTVTQNFTFPTAFLKVYFNAPVAAPAGTTLSDPQLDGLSGYVNGGVFSQDPAVDTAHAEGLNQNGVNTGEAHMVLRVHDNTVFQVTPSAVINLGGAPGTGRTTFSPFYIKPNQGDVIVVGVPGSLSLVVNTPADGQKLSTCAIPVAGTATGAPGITITVNGNPVATTSANDPGDPYKVSFSTAVAGGGATTITVTASAANNSPVTEVLHVTATSAALSVTSSVATNSLWPPNHDMVNVGFAASASTACDAHPTIGVTVYSTESDTGQPSNSNFSPDAMNIAPGTLELRAERDPGDNGRVYLIVSKGSDHFGDSGYGCTAVTVPKDQSAASIAAVTAMANAAVAACQANGAAPAGYVQVGIGPVIGPKQ